MLDWISEKEDVWYRLQKAPWPIVLYGMGNGAEKILDACQDYGIPVAGIFASDAFVRGQSFRGFPVLTLREMEENYPEFIILLAFGTHDGAMIEKIQELACRHPLLAPDVPIAGDGLFTKRLVEQNQELIRRVEAGWADEFSRELFRELINYKLSGEISYLFHTTPAEESWHLLAIKNKESYLDVGAYTGDTIEIFLSHCGGSFQKIIALEADEKNFLKLEKKVSALGLANVELHRKAAYCQQVKLILAAGNGRGSQIGCRGKLVEGQTIDNIVGDRPITLLKMDIEGGEKDALAGAEKTLRRYRPRLMISAYHRVEDLWALFEQIKTIEPSYQLYLRRHASFPAWEINIIGKIC